MKSDSLLTLSSKLSYYKLNSNKNESIPTSLTDVSNLSILKMNLNQTCSCSTCTCSNNNSIIYQNKIQSNYLENNNDCLTYTFITLYECSIWCIQIIYEFFFKSLWQIFIYIKQELQYNQNRNKISNNIDMISINENYPLISKKQKYSKLSKYHLSRNIYKDKNLFSNKIHHSISNKIFSQEKTNSSIDKHIILVPIRSSYCQTKLSNNDLHIINIDLNQSEKNLHLHEQLTERFYRRLQEPLIFINRQISGTYNQTSVISNIPSKHIYSQLELHKKNELSSSNKPTNNLVSTSYLNNQNNKQSTINTNLSPRTSAFTIPNSFHKSPSFHHTDSTYIQSNNSQSFLFNLYQRESFQNKFKQKQHIIEDNFIPLALTTSLHSNISLYNEDYFLTNYIHQLFNDKYYLQ